MTLLALRVAVLEYPDYIIEHPLQFAPATTDPDLLADVQAEAARYGMPPLALGDDPARVLCALGSLSGQLAHINALLSRIEDPYGYNPTPTSTSNEAVERVIQQARQCLGKLRQHIAVPLANLLREFLVAV
jgi:hypothetical protein